MKVKRYLASWNFFGAQLAMDCHPSLFIGDGIPDKQYDVVAIYLNTDNHTAWIHVTHDSFEDIPEGAEIPVMHPQFINCSKNHPCEYCGHNRAECKIRKKARK